MLHKACVQSLACTRKRAANQAIAAIEAQLSAHRRHSSAHFRIRSSPTASQDVAQASQIAAHKVLMSRDCAECLVMKSALVAQIWAQSSSSVMWAASACLPPFSRQWRTVCVQVR